MTKARRAKKNTKKTATRTAALCLAVCLLIAGGGAALNAINARGEENTAQTPTIAPVTISGPDIVGTRAIDTTSGQWDGAAADETEILAYAQAAATGVNTVNITAPTTILVKESTLQLTATLIPADTDDTIESWTSSDPATATVDSSGLLTGLATGSATITARTTNGVSGTITITIREPNAWDLLTDELKKSSYGFYLWRSLNAHSELERETAADAAAIIADSTLPAVKLTGKPGSATSLDNMRKGARALIKANEFRSMLVNEPCRTDLADGEGRVCADANQKMSDYLASDTYFAIAQVNADYSDTIMDHARHHGQTYPTMYPIHTSEVIAWNRDKLNNNEMPTGLYQWYDEKYDYDNDTGEEIWHYMTITDKAGRGVYIPYTVAGFAVATTGTMSGDTTELMECEPAWEKYSGYTQSAEEYLADVEAYIALVSA